jgi:hypothetical protein
MADSMFRKGISAEGTAIFRKNGPSVTMTLPCQVARSLGIVPGDVVRCKQEGDSVRLIIQKIVRQGVDMSKVDMSQQGVSPQPVT